MNNSDNFSVTVIGVGNMGSAIVRGMIRRGEFTKEHIIICDLDEKKVEKLVVDLGVKYASSARKAVEKSDFLILAAKPQSFPGLLSEISQFVNTNQTIMSIAAGVTTASIEETIGKQVPVIRVMPNLPALIGKGISVYCSGSYSTDKDINRAKTVLLSVGKIIEAPESLLDPVTALSGTGPAYIFHTMEAMIQSGIEMGIDREIAVDLVLQTVLGSAELAMKSKRNISSLREDVTSKGGTTEAAISYLTKKKYFETVINAILEARNRSKELGEG